MSNIDGYKLFQANVLKLEEITTGVFILSYKKTHEFLAGQVVAISTDLNDKPRLYSIASGVREEEVRILFNVVPEGKLTTQMSQLVEGNKIFVSKPFGKFTGTKDPAYWIAAGTGIAPFASMFYSGLASNKILIHGGRTLNAFYFRNIFEVFFEDHYIPCCSRESGQGVFQGRLTEYIKSLNDLPVKHKYYLCGSAEMVVETRDILIQKGIPFKQIIAEIYF